MKIYQNGLAPQVCGRRMFGGNLTY